MIMPLMSHKDTIETSGLLNDITQVNSVISSNFTYGGENYDTGKALIQTNDNGFILAGYTSSFGAGANDSWLIKTDAAGIVQWNYTYGGDENDSMEAFIHTNDNGLALAGSTYSYSNGESDFWLVKTDINGSVAWNKSYGDSGWEGANAIIQTHDGGYALAGSIILYGETQSDFWLVKTDNNGTIEWNQSYGGQLDDWAIEVIQTIDDGYLLTGTSYSYGEGESDIWLIKTDNNGTLLWNQTFGKSGHDGASALVHLNDSDRILLAGYSWSVESSNYNVIVIETYSNGTIAWNQTYGGQNHEIPKDILPISLDSFVLVGSERSLNGDQNNTNAFFMRIYTNSTLAFSFTYGGSQFDETVNIVQVDTLEYQLVGTTWSFDSRKGDIWLVKINLGPLTLDTSGDITIPISNGGNAPSPNPANLLESLFTNSPLQSLMIIGGLMLSIVVILFLVFKIILPAFSMRKEGQKKRLERQLEEIQKRNEKEKQDIEGYKKYSWPIESEDDY
jgi:hypothetical protein